MEPTKFIECLLNLHADYVPEYGYDAAGKTTLDRAATKKHMESRLRRPLTDLEETVLSFGRRRLGPTPALPRSEAKRLHKAIWKRSAENNYGWSYLAHALFVINETGEYYRAPLRIQRRMQKRFYASHIFEERFSSLRREDPLPEAMLIYILYAQKTADGPLRPYSGALSEACAKAFAAMDEKSGKIQKGWSVESFLIHNG